MAARVPDLVHRTLFRAVSLLASGGQGPLLRTYFDWWHRNPDPWRLATDHYEAHKYKTTLDAVPEGRYERILEVGCSEGVFTKLLADAYPDAGIVGVDISSRALGRARERVGDTGSRVRFIQADILNPGLRGDFDLVFCAELLYYLGRTPRLRHASSRLTAFMRPGAHLVAVHPWPEATRLHAFLDADPALSTVGNHVERNVDRPFAVSLYRTAPRDASDREPGEA
ncbi:class I SAM-dependent methyltransferase [Sinosporangium album]|uniref:class I SAM-dependent methyltransferase n=1 Tax=Sinosporangium album TaxID=504805 RepID=UPI0015A17EA3|nr:class I SAM-dependent methyltransferase [Sinosporangium album]